MKIRAEAEMVIKAGIDNVFRAFIEPRWLVRFWLKSASGALKRHTPREWEFMVPGVRDTVKATALQKNRRLTLRFSDGGTVDLRFRKFARSLVHITAITSAFHGKDAAAQAVASTEGYTLVLADLKTLLESGKSAGLVRDKATLIAQRLAEAGKRKT